MELLKLEPKVRTAFTEAWPGGIWTGEMAVTAGSAARSRLRLTTLELFIGAKALLGSGWSSDFPAQGTQGTFEVNGSREGDSLTFSIFFDDPEVAATAFICSGVLDSDQRRIDFTWTFACVYPDTCQCGGQTGRGQIRRIEDGPIS